MRQYLSKGRRKQILSSVYRLRPGLTTAGLFAIAKAKVGGESTFVSSISIHNELLNRGRRVKLQSSCSSQKRAFQCACFLSSNILGSVMNISGSSFGTWSLECHGHLPDHQACNPFRSCCFAQSDAPQISYKSGENRSVPRPFHVILQLAFACRTWWKL